MSALVRESESATDSPLCRESQAPTIPPARDAFAIRTHNRALRIGPPAIYRYLSLAPAIYPRSGPSSDQIAQQLAVVAVPDALEALLPIVRELVPQELR